MLTLSLIILIWVRIIESPIWENIFGPDKSFIIKNLEQDKKDLQDRLDNERVYIRQLESYIGSTLGKVPRDASELVK